MESKFSMKTGIFFFAVLAGVLTFTAAASAEPAMQYLWSMDTDPGWTVEGEWAFGQPQGLGGESFGYPDPMSGYTGTNVYGINLEGDYALAEVGPMYLTTGAIDCSGLTQVSLRFQRWLNADWLPWTLDTLEVSNDGLNWTELWNNGWAEIAEDAWSEQVFDISAYADNQVTVYIRWGHEIAQASGAWAYSGWNIDDVAIYGEEAGTVSAALGCDPASGQLPFSVAFQVQMANVTAENRRIAARIDVATGGGVTFDGWRSGFTNMTPGELFSTSWSQYLPALGTLAGDNVFTLVAEDVTPAPYNQPPYLPSGDSDAVQCTVTAAAP